MIELLKVSKNFGGKAAVKKVSFFVKTEEKFVLLGRSGCGKTTTLKMINRLIEPTEGSIRIRGKDILQEKPTDLRKSIGYVIQGVGLFPHYTVRQNIGLVPQLRGWDAKKIRQRCDELLHILGLPEAIAECYPHELSGGQQQRVGVARALAADPPIVLLDEPFGALDPITRGKIQREFKALDTLKQKTLVMVTHDVFEAVTLADTICLMDAGEIQQVGSPKELIFSPVNEYVRNFFDTHRFQLELQVVTLKDIIAAMEEETHSSVPAATEVMNLPEDTPLLQTLEELEKIDHTDLVIEIKTVTNQRTHYLSRDMIFSAFYKVKEKWK